MSYNQKLMNEFLSVKKTQSTIKKFEGQQISLRYTEYLNGTEVLYLLSNNRIILEAWKGGDGLLYESIDVFISQSKMIQEREKKFNEQHYTQVYGVDSTFLSDSHEEIKQQLSSLLGVNSSKFDYSIESLQVIDDKVNASEEYYALIEEELGLVYRYVGEILRVIRTVDWSLEYSKKEKVYFAYLKNFKTGEKVDFFLLLLNEYHNNDEISIMGFLETELDFNKLFLAIK